MARRDQYDPGNSSNSGPMLRQGRGVNRFRTAERLAAEQQQDPGRVRDREGTMNGVSQSLGRLTDGLTQTSAIFPGGAITVDTGAGGDIAQDKVTVFEFYADFQKGEGVMIEAGGLSGGILVGVAPDGTFIVRCGNGGAPPNTAAARISVPIADLPARAWVTVEVRAGLGVLPLPRVRCWINRVLLGDEEATAVNAQGVTGANDGGYYITGGGFQPEEPSQPVSPHTSPAGSLLRIFKDQEVDA